LVGQVQTNVKSNVKISPKSAVKFCKVFLKSYFLWKKFQRSPPCLAGARQGGEGENLLHRDFARFGSSTRENPHAACIEQAACEREGVEKQHFGVERAMLGE